MVRQKYKYGDIIRCLYDETMPITGYQWHNHTTSCFDKLFIVIADEPMERSWNENYSYQCQCLEYPEINSWWIGDKDMKLIGD